MSTRIRDHLRTNVVGYVALFLVLTGGTAYALDGSNTVFSDDIVNGEVKTGDLANGGVTSAKIIDGGVKTQDLATDAVTSAKVAPDTLGADDIGSGAVGSDEVTNESLTNSDLATDSVQATEVANDSIDSGEIVDFGLSNQDVGVEFAQINADGTVFSSSGGVTGIHIGTGTYEVDFGHNISSCAYVVTQGEGGVGGASGGITGVTDRSGNAEATFTTMRTDANVLVDRAFQEIVVC